MKDVAIARGLHVFGVVLWIGGVGFVTTVLLPALRRLVPPEHRMETFVRIERGFAWQARVTTVLVAVSGLYIAWAWDLWDRFLSVHYWWMHAMVVVWLLFTVLLFVVEPLFLDRWLLRRAAARPEQTFRLVERLHWVLLAVSLLAVFGAAAGSHGGF